jgi:hypothetical protein
VQVAATTEQIQVRLERELTPEQYRDVCQLADLRAAHVCDQAGARLERFLELVAAHSPAMAPAIRCVGRHIMETVDEVAAVDERLRVTGVTALPGAVGDGDSNGCRFAGSLDVEGDSEGLSPSERV